MLEKDKPATDRNFIQPIIEVAETRLNIMVGCLSLHEESSLNKATIPVLFRSDGRCPQLSACDLSKILNESRNIRQCELSTFKVSKPFRTCVGIPGYFNNKSINSDAPKELARVSHSLLLRQFIYNKSIAHFGHSAPVIIVGLSVPLLQSLEYLESIAQSMVPVLLEGETGTGKELWARACHLLHLKHNEPFVPVNCSLLQDESKAISALFGHVKGSYTGAIKDRQGYFRQANNGTIFLDEVQALPLEVQGMLLRTLDRGEVYPMGADKPSFVNLQVTAASNRSLSELVDREVFRKDLYYRLKVHHICLAPLRNRSDDIPVLARHFLAELNRKERTNKELTDKAFEHLKRYSWPGNVRELRHVIVSAFYRSADAQYIKKEHLRAALESNRQTTVESSSAIPDKEIESIYREIVQGTKDFWEAVAQPFRQRDLNRKQVQTIIKQGMEETCSYKALLQFFNLDSNQYQKFMDFLRHHNLRPGQDGA